VRRAGFLVLLLAGCDCSAARPEVIVELKTDYRPGLEFDRVETFLYRGTEMADVLGHVDEVAAEGDDYVAGFRVATLRAAKNGAHRLRVRIWKGERIRAQNVAHVEVSGRTIVRVILTRSCESVMCPVEGGDAFAIACLGGRCVLPECAVEDPPPECAAQCTADDGCPAPAAACGQARCERGVCLAIGDDAMCAEGSFCVPELGCVRVDMMDAGSEIDAGEDDAGPIDAGGLDAGGMDAGGADGGPLDAGPPDAGPPDAGPRDAGLRDAGPRDAGPRDAGSRDAGPAMCGSCEDGNICTTDVCMAGSCVNMPNTVMCDDGNACTVMDRCSMRVCAGTSRSCNDMNVCTTDTCSPTTGCVFTNNTSACDDLNTCTTGDRCGGGVCRGTTITCDDFNVCTTDSCDPGGGCRYTNNTLMCNDGNPCTFMDRCSSGTCIGGGVAPDGTLCDDGLYCNGADTCSGGTCSHNPVICVMPGTACDETTDSCVPCGADGQICCGTRPAGTCMAPSICCPTTNICDLVCPG
jgi:hypothetical protein